jgi:hypothetical protein
MVALYLNENAVNPDVRRIEYVVPEPAGPPRRP